MSVEFNKERLFRNIHYLIKKRGVKIGDLETSSGVSTGYIARTMRDEKSKPGIEFVMKVAEELWVTTDELLRLDLEQLTETEKYLHSFLSKLVKDTNAGKVEWQVESVDELDRPFDMNGNSLHPLYDIEDYQGLNGFKSHVSGYATVGGDCYFLKMKNRTTLYVMDYLEAENEDGIYDAHDYKELWLCKETGGRQYLCSNVENDWIASLVSDLYIAIKDYSNHPKISNVFRSAIDAFMNDENPDESTEISEEMDLNISSDDLPF